MRPAEPEAPHPPVEARRLELHADHHRAHVRRAGQDLRCRQCAVAVLVGLTDGPVGHLDLAGHLEDRVGLDQALLERTGHRERLEGRAGLVVELDGPVLAGVVGGARRVVRVHARPVGQRQDRPGAGVHDERRRAGGLVGLSHLAQHRLDALLNRPVEREPDVLAGLGAIGLDQAYRLAERVLDQPAVPVIAAEGLLLRVLEPGQPGVLGPHRAEQLGGQGALGVRALGLDDRVDALDPELVDLVPQRRVHLVTQVDEARVAVAQLLEQVVLVDAEQGREPGCDARRVVDQEGVREHRHGVLGDRQLHAVAIHDRAAPGRHDHVLHLLLHARGRPASRP